MYFYVIELSKNVMKDLFMKKSNKHGHWSSLIFGLLIFLNLL